MSKDSIKKNDDEIDLEQVEYVEHRMMFLGHIFTETGYNKSINFSFNDYNHNGEKIVKERSNDILSIINNIYNTPYIDCKKVLYNFLNNGCVSIVIYYEVHNIHFMLNGYQKLAGENFLKINKMLFLDIKKITEEDIESKNCFKFIKEIKYGIPKKLIEKNDTSFVTDTMVYSQHFIFKNYYKFLEKSKFEEDIEKLKELAEDIENLKKEFIKIKDLKYKPLKFGWGIRYWEEDNCNYQNTKNDKFDFLDTEFLFLSRQVLVNSQIMISTDISKDILFKEEYTKNIDIEDLESFICSYKTFHQINDLMLMDFNEDTRLINSALFKYDDSKDLEESKKNGEDTILKILKNYETKSNKTSENIVGIILFIIGALTIYSVIHDIFQFMPIDKEGQNTHIRPRIIFGITLMISVIAIYIINKRFKMRIFDKIKNLCKTTFCYIKKLFEKLQFGRNMKNKLYLDDVRNLPDASYVLVRSYKEAVNYVEKNGIPSFISFDHDLGVDENDKPIETGYDFAKWLVDMDLDNIYKFPENFSFYVHSANSVGKENIDTYLTNYLNFKNTK
ncbi:cyclic-phosphate processing receiver domain-containing protein [Aliarcobacter cryaerophilus]|uniref:Cyclic-phosphate processing Receiver domain-containing protein n=1 Tax=Arcobacter sp. AZ-2023 TaxID=3074453 RepID=A0AA96DM95_9BACT|nr:hypothetical protein RMQ68_03660 [Arcobacter sp. AZ-2023]